LMKLEKIIKSLKQWLCLTLHGMSIYEFCLIWEWCGVYVKCARISYCKRMAQEKAKKSPAAEVVTREYTINLHKRLHGLWETCLGYD
jgi:hypothetical protein